MTGGPSPLGSERGRVTPTLILAASELPPPGPSAPVTVVTVPWPRNERGALAGLKTISYGENVRALAVAKEAGAGEAIFANTRGELCEGTGTNVFVVTGGVLRTPPEDVGLPPRGHPGADPGAGRPARPSRAEEATLPLTAWPPPTRRSSAPAPGRSSRSRPVDGNPLPVAPGPVTTLLADAFRRMVADDLDP